jgi:manganese transport protein
MDPGNWATDLEGGASFGYTLLWVLLMSNLMALLLQTLSARLGIVAGKDLAQACRDFYPKPVAISLWILCEIAIIACDLAEVLGTAIGINLLFGMPILWGVFVTALDVLVLLVLQRLGMKKLELFIISLVVLIGGCFLIEIFLAKPNAADVASGLIPHLNGAGLYIAIGIIGATVMPHNLYLHSALVQTRQFDQTPDGKRQACKFNLIDSAIALNGAFFINAAILILAGSVFFARGEIVTEIQQAHQLLSPLLGTTMAGILFAVALLASGQSSTVTGTLAGQIVMEGFLHLRIRPAVRRLITRSLAIVPAALIIWSFGESSTISLLILSQVVLSMQLSFAVIPLIHFTSDKLIMGEFVNKLWVKVLAWITAAIVLGLNIRLLVDKVTEAVTSEGMVRTIGLISIPFLIFIGVLLIYILIKPFFAAEKMFAKIRARYKLPEPVLTAATHDRAAGKYASIGIALDASENDSRLIEQAYSMLKEGGEIVLIHIASSASGFFNKEQARDATVRESEAYLAAIKDRISIQYRIGVRAAMGFGDIPKELVRIAQEQKFDLLVMGSHGHRGIADLIFGATVSPVRHALTIPVFIVQ